MFTASILVANRWRETEASPFKKAVQGLGGDQMEPAWREDGMESEAHSIPLCSKVPCLQNASLYLGHFFLFFLLPY